MLLPYKALTNEKFDEFSQLYGQQLGLRVIRCTGDRYTLEARGETCQAVTVAEAGAGNHLEFSAGSPNRRGGAWYFTEQPGPALGCLAPDDWLPPPERP